MPRGRPRKPDPFAWMDDLPSYLDEMFPVGNLDGVREFNRQETERLRREAVSESILDAYGEGRNKANEFRQLNRDKRRLAVSVKYQEIIARPLTTNSVAAYITRNNPEIGLSVRTLRSYVSEIRKLAEPNRVKK